MAALLLNDYQTTAAAGITSGATTLTTAAAIPGAGASDTIRMRNTRTGEIFDVTAGGNSTAWTISRAVEDASRWPAAAMNAGDVLEAVPTSAILDVLRGIYSPRRFGPGTTATEIQAAIDAASAAGGGMVVVSGGTWTLATSLTLKNDVVVAVRSGTTVRWTGSAGGAMVTNGSTDPLRRSGFFGEPGAIVDPNGSAGYVFDLHSPQECTFGDFEVLAGTATTVYCRVQADATNASGYESSRNAVFNLFKRVSINGTCGRVYLLDGQSTGVVTLNRFEAIEARDVRVVGIDIAEWVDNNTFSGYVRLELQANNAVGVVFNSASPTTNVGVYSNHFTGMLAVDSFVGLTGRVGVKLNNSKTTFIAGLHVNPAAEGGDVLDNGYAESYYILRTGRAKSGQVDVLRKGVTVAPAGVVSDAYRVTDGAMTAASATLTCASSGTFAAADVGKPITVAGAGDGGRTLVTTISAVASATVVTLATAASTTVSNANVTYGTDGTAALQRAIDTAATYGGDVELGNGAYVFASTVRLKADTVVTCQSGTILYYLGAEGGTMFDTDPTLPTKRSGLIGRRSQINLNGLADRFVDAISCQYCEFGGFEIREGRASTAVVRMASTASSITAGYEGRRHTAYNLVRDLYVKDACGWMVYLDGVDAAGIVTLNSFQDLDAADVRIAGIWMDSWCDNNAFRGVIRVQLLANGAQGLVVNGSSAGVVNRTTLTAGGTGHTAPTVTFSAPAARSVTALTRSGTTASATSTAHTFRVGDVVTIAGAGPAGYNGTVTITGVPDANTFQYTVASSLSTPATGTITATGQTATGFATASGGAVTAIYIVNPGSGYGSAPTVTFGGGGSGATATTTLGGPTVDVGVYNNVMQHFAPDTFSGYTGRIGLTLNKSKGTTIMALHQDPAAEGGVLVGTNADSYFVRQIGVAASATVIEHRKGNLTSGVIGYGPDANAYLGFSGSDPVLQFDSTDYLTYVRSVDQLRLFLGGAQLAAFTTGGFILNSGLIRNGGMASDTGAAASDWWYNTTQKSHRFRNAAAVQGLVGLIYANTADSTAITGTTSETKFSTQVALAAAGLTVGKVIRVRLMGTVTTDNTASQTLTINIKLGDATNATSGTTVATTRLALTISLTNANWYCEADIIIRSATTAWGAGFASVGSTVAAPWTATPAHVSNGGGVGTVTTIPNISTAHTVHVTAIPNDTGQSVVIRTMTVELLD